MRIWRLIAHHEEAAEAIEEMKERNRIAIGWTKIGDLRETDATSASDITSLISAAHHPIENAHMGGPSLWNLYHHMQAGDLVIVNANGKRICVFEVLGPYLFESGRGEIKGYAHQRSACLTNIDPEELWGKSGSAVAIGQNIRWTLAECTVSDAGKTAIYREGQRFSVISTAIERNPRARRKCLEHFGCKCFVCNFEFSKTYGELGGTYIHVHHRVDISMQPAEYEVNPTKDLVPLCPNCHAMVHQARPAMAVEELRAIYEKNNA